MMIGLLLPAHINKMCCRLVSCMLAGLQVLLKSKAALPHLANRAQSGDQAWRLLTELPSFGCPGVPAAAGKIAQKAAHQRCICLVRQ